MSSASTAAAGTRSIITPGAALSTTRTGAYWPTPASKRAGSRRNWNCSRCSIGGGTFSRSATCVKILIYAENHPGVVGRGGRDGLPLRPVVIYLFPHRAPDIPLRQPGYQCLGQLRHRGAGGAF